MYFVTDIDDTLIDNKYKIAKGVVESIQTLADNNITLVLATSRSLHDALLIGSRYQIQEHVVIACGGRFVGIAKNGKVNETIYQNFDVSYGLYMARTGYAVMFQTKDGRLIHVEGYRKPNNIWDEIETVSYSEFLECDLQNYIMEYDGTYKDAISYSTGKWHPFIYNKRVYLYGMPETKGTGLSRVLEYYPGRVVGAVGDDTNDIPFMEMSERVYVMQDAKQELFNQLKLSYTVVPDSRSGGVSTAISHVYSALKQIEFRV